MRSVSVKVAMIAGLVMTLAVPAMAQKAELSVGYQSLTLKSDIDETLGKGWYLELAGNVNSVIGIVGQVGGSYKTITETSTVGGVTGTATGKVKLHQFMGGIRFNARAPVVKPFAEILVGGVNSRAELETSVGTTSETLFESTLGESATNFATQLGAGLNIGLGGGLGARVSASYLRISGDEDAHVNALRAAAGLVLSF
jgi:hypothetical protein